VAAPRLSHIRAIACAHACSLPHEKGITSTTFAHRFGSSDQDASLYSPLQALWPSGAWCWAHQRREPRPLLCRRHCSQSTIRFGSLWAAGRGPAFLAASRWLLAVWPVQCLAVLAAVGRLAFRTLFGVISCGVMIWSTGMSLESLAAAKAKAYSRSRNSRRPCRRGHPSSLQPLTEGREDVLEGDAG
jgi:hypothetical protein